MSLLRVPHAGPPASWPLESNEGRHWNSHSPPASRHKVNADLHLFPSVGDNLLDLPHDLALGLQHFVWHHLLQNDEGVMRVEGRGHQDVLVHVEVVKSDDEAVAALAGPEPRDVCTPCITHDDVVK